MNMTIAEEAGAEGHQAHIDRRQWVVDRPGIARDHLVGDSEEVVVGAEEVGEVGMDIGRDRTRGRGVDHHAGALPDHRTEDLCRGHHRHGGEGMDGAIRRLDAVDGAGDVVDAVEAMVVGGEVQATARMGAGVREIGV